HIPDAHGPIRGAGHQAGAVGREDWRTTRVEAIAMSAEHTDQIARLGVPEAKCRILRASDDARTVRAEEDMPHLVGMPAQDSQPLPRAPVPEPRRLVHRGRDHAPAVRAEGNGYDAILVSFEAGQQSAGGRVPEARRAVGVSAPRN